MNLAIKYIETIEELSKSNDLHSGVIADFTKEILEKSCNILDCERSNAWLLNNEADKLKCIMSYTKGSNSFESNEVLNKKELPKIFKNLFRNEIIVSNDDQSGPVNTELLENYLIKKDITSMIEIPLRSEGNIVGVICFEHVNKVHEWSDDEKKYTISMAQLLSLALETNRKREYRINLERMVKEKEVLISEINHRVKNNMAIILSLLNMQKGNTKDLYHAELLEGVKNKVYAMSTVHDQLHASGDVNDIDFCIYIKKLVMNLNNSYKKENGVSISLDLENIKLDVSKAIPCGLIANEVLTNSFKYAFDKKNLFPELKVSLKRKGNKIELNFKDNGRGFDSANIKFGMGLDLLIGLSDQVNGDITINSSKGVKVSLVFNCN